MDGGLGQGTTQSIGVMVSNASGLLDPGVVIAGVRCGARGLLNCEHAGSLSVVQNALIRIERFAGAGFGVKLDASVSITDEILAQLPSSVDLIVFSGRAGKTRLKNLLASARRPGRSVFLELTSAKQASAAVKQGWDAFIAKGSEAGGEESLVTLLPAVVHESKVPVWAYGGVGVHTVGACYAAGARGVVLSSQVLLTGQSNLPTTRREAVEAGVFEDLPSDAALAAPLANRFVTVAGVVDALQSELRKHIEAARKTPHLTAFAGGPAPVSVSTSFVDWELAIMAARQSIDTGADPSGIEVVFTGGIRDAASAAMLAAAAAPLTARGVKVLAAVEAGDAAAILNGAAEILQSLPELVRPVATACEQKPADIAIVGMSCLLPKALDVHSLWRNLLNKVDAIDHIPADRFDSNLYFDADKKKRDKIYAKSGGFLDPVPFDPLRYGIPPASLGSIDPMQLLALVGVENALRDAGYDRREFNRERMSVILGISGGLGELGVDYAFRSNLPLYVKNPPEEVLKQVPEWTEDSFAGLLPNVAAGRVANRFNFGGVNFIVDAACASSLASVYVAARELNAGACDMVVVGGVDATQNPFGFLCFSKAQALSPRGRCRPFDASADGIAISEGVTMLVLKRLADAERDGDRIYAVVKGMGGSSDGRGRSMTAPRLEGQVLALRRAYAQAGVDSSTIGLIEAHGTGTSTGDATEIAALDTVFRSDNAAPQTCAVGSIKSMVGHTKSAAGATSLMKVALSLYHKVLPPTLHVETPNPRLREDGTPFFVCTDPQPFLPAAPGIPRRAGISAFGFGGTNFHALVEEYQRDYSDPLDRATVQDWPAELFLWTADSPDALSASLGLLEAALDRAAPPALRDLALSVSALAGVRKETGLRLAIVAASHQQLLDRIAAVRKTFAAGKRNLSENGVYLAPAAPRAKLAFLFPGQGSQYPNMLRDLAIHFPEFRLALERVDEGLAGKFPTRISSLIFPPSAFTDDERKAQMKAITDTVVAQPALGIIEIALAKLLSRLGVAPDMVAGHSYGEYAALAAAGVFDEDALFRISETRGRVIKESVGADSGTMAAVAVDAATVAEAIEGVDVCIANYNSPAQTIIAGSTKAVAAALERLKEKKLAARGIPVACAFHSPLMHGASRRFAAYLAGQSFGTPAVPVYSNTLAAPYPSDTEQIAALLASHIERPVRFADEVSLMYEDGARVFLEVGPKGVLSGLARQILEGKDCAIVQAETTPERHGIPQFLNALAQLAVHSVPIDVQQLFRGRAAQRLDLANLPPEARAAGWAMTPSRVFPAGKQRQVRSTPVPLEKPSDAPSKVVTVTVEKVVEKIVEKPVPSALPAAAGSGAIDEVLLQFQNLMTRFLETQSTVMSAYLQSAATGIPAIPAVPFSQTSIPALPPLPAPAPIMAPPPVTSAPPVTLPPAVTLPAAAAATSAVSAAPAPIVKQRDIAAELLAIAAERTGYPADMLDLDVGIEADLGIDSIKRVEILTAFQHLRTADEQAQVQSVMDKLTSARTLEEMIERLRAVIGPSPAPAPVASSPVAPAPVAVQRDIAAELLAIAADRTGYPADMLDLNAGIEADLGIDSIKRVEIFTAFQHLCTPDEQAQVQSVMDKLTSARTLKEITGCLVAAIQPAPPAAASPAAPALVAVQRDIAAELLAIAADRTGYPADMLDLNAGIEADLGIDSIKRVEILTAFQHLCTPDEQAQVQSVMDKLTSARTLKEITGCLVAAIQPAPPAASAVPRFRLAPIDKQRSAAASAHVPGRVVLITDDETGLATGIAEEFDAAGEIPILLRHSPGNGIIAAEGVISGDLTDPGAIDRILEQIRARHGAVGALIHLLPLRAGNATVEYTLDAWRDHARQDLRSLYALARACETDLRGSGHGLFAAITARGGAFGYQPSPGLQPTHHGVADFVKTVALEFTGVLCKVIDIDPTDPLPILRRKVANELISADDTLQVGLPGDRRLTVLPEHAPITAEPLRRITRDWVVLLTGGARGITAGVAQKLAERYQPVLVLAGASPLPGEEPPQFAGITDRAALKAAVMQELKASGNPVKPAAVEAACQRLLKDREIRAALDQLRHAGSQVSYHSLDVRDEGAMTTLIQGIYAEYGRLDAVIHGAGIIEDKLLKDKTPESFDRVVHTKVDSSWLLSRLLKPESLQCLVLMSSITAAFGNRAQADYAIANGVMNGFALKLAAEWKGRVVAMNWGPWDQHGMVTEEVRRQFLSRRIHMIPPEAGVEAVLLEIERGDPRDAVVAFGEGPWGDVAVPDGTARARPRSLGAVV